MTIPTNEQVENFKKELEELEIDKIDQNLRHYIYGVKDNWKYKEALAFIQTHKESAETGIKKESIKQAQENNRLQGQANRIAWWALFTSILALAISILVAFFK